MPWKLEKQGDQYFVVDGAGKKYSDKPMSKWRAKRQLAALYANEAKAFIEHTGAMVALPVPEAYRLVEGMSWPQGSEVLPPEEMHVTLAFLGDIVSGDVDPSKLYDVVKKYALSKPPIIGRINGYGVFTETHMEGKACFWLSLDAPGLPEFRQGLIKALQSAGFTPADNHGFTPHITVAYFDKGVNIMPPMFEPQPVMIMGLRAAWGGLVNDFPFGVIAENAMGMKDEEKGFRVFKQADGSYRWVSLSSSAFRDRDGELVTVRALEEDVDRCDKAKDYGPLRWWHVGGWEAPDGPERWDTWRANKGADLGTCDFNMLHGRMLIESGTFKDAAMGDAFASLPYPLEVSIAFSHPRDEPTSNKAYNNIHRFERSLLPAGMASNLLTQFSVVKGASFMKTTEKLQALVAILRNKPEVATQILADSEAIQKAAESAGLEYKEVSDLLSEPPAAEAVVDPPAAAVDAPVVVDPVVAEVAETAPVAVTEPPAPVAEVAKAAPVEPDEIGDMTHADLAAFVTDMVNKMMGKKEAEAELKQSGVNQLLADAIDANKALAIRLAAAEKAVADQQAVLSDFTDARPVGIKQLMTQRPSETLANVVSTVPTGPQMDDAFRKFSQGGLK